MLLLDHANIFILYYDYVLYILLPMEEASRLHTH